MSAVFLRASVNRFVTLFTERSGSTYLATLLDSHPDILSKREEFAHLRQRGVDGAGQNAWASGFWMPPLLGNHKAIGFKTKTIDILDPVGFASLAKDLDVRVIQLQRRNLVKAVISTLNARRLHRASGNWNLLNESDRLSGFSVKPEEFEDLLKERIRLDQELERYSESLGLRRLKLFYEDLLSNETLFVSRVLGFLEVEPRPMQGKTLKNTADNLRDAVQNFDELKGRYAGTQYHPMFDEASE